jgi:serine/threonine protein kinase
MTEPGQQIGGFRLVRELGSGGFGSVHLGQDASGGLAAVKLLHPHLAADPQVGGEPSKPERGNGQVVG